MNQQAIKLARYYLNADLLESGTTSIPATYEELRQLADDVQSLARELDLAADAWFERRKRIAAAKRAFNSWGTSRGFRTPDLDKKLARE